MAGELVSLVLLPRYTTFAGANTFTTMAMEVSDYSKALVNVWRGAASGTSPTFTASFEESTDQDSWSTCQSGTGGDPGANTEAQYQPVLSKRFFRIKIVVGGTNPAVSCWAVGYLERRED